MAGTYKEYAEALFTLAREVGAEDEYANALDIVGEAFSAEPDYIDFLVSPSIPKKERTDALEDAFAAVLPEHVMSFLCILCERGHIRDFGDCVKEYKSLLDAFKNVAVATVRSPLELTASEKERLKKKLEKISGHSVTLECSIDQSLLGGVVIELDGKVLDGSVKTRLQEVKEVISR